MLDDGQPTLMVVPASQKHGLAAKILAGGLGDWGPIPMPPHPQHNIEETQQMVDAILEMKRETTKKAEE